MTNKRRLKIFRAWLKCMIVRHAWSRHVYTASGRGGRKEYARFCIRCGAKSPR